MNDLDGILKPKNDGQENWAFWLLRAPDLRTYSTIYLTSVEFTAPKIPRPVVSREFLRTSVGFPFVTGEFRATLRDPYQEHAPLP